MGRNPEWFAQRRARGVCYLCERPMDDDDPRQSHLECQRLSSAGWRTSDIRAHPPTLGPVQPKRSGGRKR